MKKLLMGLFFLSFLMLGSHVYASTTTPSITVLSPNGGETFYFGNQLQIKVQMNSSKIGGLESYLVDNPSVTNPGNKYYLGSSGGNNPSVSNISSWGVNLIKGHSIPYITKQYYVMSTWKSNDGLENYTDFSDLPFTISTENTTTPSITVLSPNGGEVYQAGQQITVKWKSTNISNNSLVALNIAGSNPTFGFLTPNGTPNDGTEVITLGSDWSGANHKIIVGVPVNNDFSNSALSVSDSSDNYFTIKSSITEDGCINGEIYSSTTGQKCIGVPTTDETPRVSFWPGKVSQHVNLIMQSESDAYSSVTWQTDPDGVTGSGVDKLAYCKKFYPNTTSVEEYKTETFWGWRDRGNVSNYKGTKMSYKCVEGSINPTNTPVISGVSGPQTLKLSQTGTWTVKASSSNGGTLSYSVDWGDIYALSSSSANSNKETKQTATFTHSYASAGTYTPTFTVTNSSGQSATTSLSVKVSNATTPVLPPGCTSTSGYSPITGVRCDGSQGNPDGCQSGYNYSPITGQLCLTATVDTSVTDTGTGEVTSQVSKKETLRKGSKGELVKIIQEFLGLAVDGSFGPETQKKVIEWQTENGLKADGVFGSQSYQKAGLAE